MSQQQHHFININNPDDVRSRRYVWNVRSHASRSSRSPARISRAENQERRNRAAQAQRQSSTGNESEGSAGDSAEASSSAKDVSARRPKPRRNPSSGRIIQRATSAKSTASSPSRPALPQNLTELINSLSEASPYLSAPGPAPQHGLHPWPESVEEPALYLAQLLSAVELVNKTYQQPLVNHVGNLSLRVSTLRAINEVLGDPDLAHQDATLAAVVQMTLHEYKFGDSETYSMHMLGVKNMIGLRGGAQAVTSPFLHQAIRFAMAIDLDRSQDHSLQDRSVQECQLVISIHSALLTFINQPNALPQRLFWLMYQTSRHAMRAGCHFEQASGKEPGESDPHALLEELVETGPLAGTSERLDSGQYGGPDLVRIVGECTRLALIFTLFFVIQLDAPHRPNPDLANRRQALVMALRQAESQRLLGTQYAFIYAWAHFAVNGSRRPDFSIDPWPQT